MVFRTGFGSARCAGTVFDCRAGRDVVAIEGEAVVLEGVEVVVVQVHAMEACPLLGMRVPGRGFGRHSRSFR